MHEFSTLKNREKKASKKPKQYTWLFYALVIAIIVMATLLTTLVFKHMRRAKPDALARRLEHVKQAGSGQQLSRLATLYAQSAGLLNKTTTDLFGNRYVIKDVVLRDDMTYTQGLFFYDNVLYESGGQYAKSRIMTRSVADHAYTVTSFKELHAAYFAEGADYYIDDDGQFFIFQLTWLERKIIKYDSKLNVVKEIELDAQIKEGWGLTHDPAHRHVYYISDGSHNIYVCDASRDLAVTAVRPIMHNGRPMTRLNELEFVDGQIWANIYPSNYVVVIDAQTFAVARIHHFDQLSSVADDLSRKVLDRSLEDGDCLNGIAYNDSNGELLLTGKYWPVYFVIKLV